MIVAISGALLVVATFVDAALTVLHPTRRGPLSWAAERAAFAVIRRMSVTLARPKMLTAAGPAAILAAVATWVLLGWLGFALMYLPFLDDLYYTSSVTYGVRDLADALYFSGTALTTVGFGDIVADRTSLRLVSILEAAFGFGVFTARSPTSSRCIRWWRPFGRPRGRSRAKPTTRLGPRRSPCSEDRRT